MHTPSKRFRIHICIYIEIALCLYAKHCSDAVEHLTFLLHFLPNVSVLNTCEYSEYLFFEFHVVADCVKDTERAGQRE